MKFFNLQFALFLVCVLGLTAIAQAQTKPLPAHVDLSEEFEKLSLPPRAQGKRDVCSLFAVTGMANFEFARHQPLDHAPLSEEFLIWAAEQAAGKSREQAMFYEALAGLNRYGICNEKLMPYVPAAHPHEKPSAQAIHDAHRLAERWHAVWIKRWDVKSQLTDQQLTLIKQTLAAHHPVACGMRWPKNGNEIHKLLHVLPANQVEDGHSILVTGYIDDPQIPGGGKFLFRNSWGPQWGHHGYGEMAYAYMRAYANDAVWLKLGAENSEVPTFRFEGEGVGVLAHHHCTSEIQSLADYEPLLWSHGKHRLGIAEPGGYFDLGLHGKTPGRYRVRVLGTAAPDFGIVQLSFVGVERKHDFDLYSGRVAPSGSLELGEYDFNATNYILRCAVIGKNPASLGHKFGIDAIDLIAVKK